MNKFAVPRYGLYQTPSHECAVRKSFLIGKMLKNTEGFLCTLICRRNLWVRGKSYVSIVHSHALSLTGLCSVLVTLADAIWPPPVSRPIEAEALPRHSVMGRREYWLARGTWQPGVPLKHKHGAEFA